MQIIVKGKNVDVPADLKEYIEEKIGKVLEGKKDPIVCEVILIDERGTKGGIDREIHITCTAPHIKNPVFVKEVSADFFQTIDLAADKFARALHNAQR